MPNPVIDGKYLAADRARGCRQFAGHILFPAAAQIACRIREGQGRIFGEDMEMLERQQSNLTRWPDRKLLMLNIDAGGVQSRRVIDRLLAQEQGTTA